MAAAAILDTDDNDHDPIFDLDPNDDAAMDAMLHLDPDDPDAWMVGIDSPLPMPTTVTIYCVNNYDERGRTTYTLTTDPSTIRNITHNGTCVTQRTTLWSQKYLVPKGCAVAETPDGKVFLVPKGSIPCQIAPSPTPGILETTPDQNGEPYELRPCDTIHVFRRVNSLPGQSTFHLSYHGSDEDRTEDCWCFAAGEVEHVGSVDFSFAGCEDRDGNSLDPEGDEQVLNNLWDYSETKETLVRA